MSEHDDTTRLSDWLTRLASEPIEIDGARVDAIETRLMARIGAPVEDERRGAVVALAGRRRSRSVRAIALGAVAASLLAIAVLAGVFATDDDGVVIAAADGVEVVLPDGQVVDGRVGLEVPDGSSLTVAGFLEIDGVRYGPGSYVVMDDELRAVVDGGDDGSGVPADGELGTPPDGVDAPIPAPASTTTTTIARAATTTSEERVSRPDDGSGTRVTSTTVSVVRDDDDSSGRDRPAATTGGDTTDTRPVSTSTLPPQRPPTTDAPMRTTTTTEASRDQPPSTRPATTTAAPRDRPTTTPAPTTSIPADTTSTVGDRPPRQP